MDVNTADVEHAPTGSRRRRRWWIVASVVVFAGYLALSFSNNTDRMRFYPSQRPAHGRPGETITVVVDNAVEEVGGCWPHFDWFARPTAFGRWRQTHWVSDPDEIRWWLLKTRTYEKTSECSGMADPGRQEITIPNDVSWSPIAACDMLDTVCLRIDVDLADG